jgi:hypothetical protein
MSNPCPAGPSCGGVVASIFIDKAVGCRSTGREMVAGHADEPTVMPNLDDGRVCRGASGDVHDPDDQIPEKSQASVTSIGWKIQTKQVVWYAWAMNSRQKLGQRFNWDLGLRRCNLRCLKISGSRSMTGRNEASRTSLTGQMTLKMHDWRREASLKLDPWNSVWGEVGPGRDRAADWRPALKLLFSAQRLDEICRQDRPGSCSAPPGARASRFPSTARLLPLGAFGACCRRLQLTDAQHSTTTDGPRCPTHSIPSP